MKFTPVVSALKHAALMGVGLALLSACAVAPQRPASPAPAQTSTYAKANWNALPAVADTDLQAGFAAWRSACPRLKTEANWAPTCAAAANVANNPSAIRQFLQANLDVYALRAANSRADGLITGYYEPIYAGSLTRTAKASVPAA